VVLIEPPLFCAPAAVFVSCTSGSLSWLNIKDFELDAAFALGILRSARIRRWMESVERWWLRRFDCVSSISPAMVERARQKGVASARLVLCRDFVDLDRIREDLDGAASMRARFGITPGQMMVLYSGNLGLKQGLEIVSEAARSLRHRPDIRFVICGEGAAKEALANSARGLCNIQLHGLVPEAELNALLHAADVHLLPQKVEAAELVMPSKLLYMLASARPIVATAELGTEVGQTVTACGGRLVSPGDASALGQALVEYAGDPVRRAQAGRAGRAYAQALFDRNVVLGEMLDQFVSRTSSRRGSGGEKAWARWGC